MSKRWKYDIDDLKDLYLNQKKSILNIAKEKGVGYKAVRNALLREKIPLRSRNEAGIRKTSEETKAKLRKRFKGKNGTNYGGKIMTSKTLEALERGRRLGVSKEANLKRSLTRIRKGLSKGDNNPMKKEENVKKWIKANRVSPNKCEKFLYKILNEMYPNKYEMNVEGDFLILDGAIPDFVDTSKDKRIIELFGEYWHEKEEEEKRILRFKKFGYNTLVVWSKELKKIDKLKNKITMFHLEEEK